MEQVIGATVDLFGLRNDSSLLPIGVYGPAFERTCARRQLFWSCFGWSTSSSRRGAADRYHLIALCPKGPNTSVEGVLGLNPFSGGTWTLRDGSKIPCIAQTKNMVKRNSVFPKAREFRFFFFLSSFLGKVATLRSSILKFWRLLRFSLGSWYRVFLTLTHVFKDIGEHHVFGGKKDQEGSSFSHNPIYFGSLFVFRLSQLCDTGPSFYKTKWFELEETTRYRL